MKNGPNKKELAQLRIIHKAMWILIGCIGIGILFTIYLFLRPIILEEYCDAKAKEAAKYYKDFLIKPPQDLLEEYKDSPGIINENSQPTPYYVELLRCELKLSKRFWPFLHFNHEN